MPSLKDLTCSIELPDSEQILQEFGTIYGDAFVETFVGVPRSSKPFTIHLTSEKFIAHGIALFVYIDGVYQCNRNKQKLGTRKRPENRSLVDFRVRQKEETQKDGSMIAREWTFQKLNASADSAPDRCSPNVLDNIGCIEVVVLRCAGPRNADKAPPMNFDGANDAPDYAYSFNGRPRTATAKSTYDDRHPFSNSVGKGFGPPPPMPFYRAPYVETVHTQEDPQAHNFNGSQTSRPVSGTKPFFSVPVSPGTRVAKDLPPSGYMYGSGPIPFDERLAYNSAPSVAVTNAPGVNAGWLDWLLKKAVKQGVKESRREDKVTVKKLASEQHEADTETSSQFPGAWPPSPSTASKQSKARSAHHSNADHDDSWDESKSTWGDEPQSKRKEGHVTWEKDDLWEEDPESSEWTEVNETSSDAWNTGDSPQTKHYKSHKDYRNHKTSRRSAARSSTRSPSISPTGVRTSKSKSRGSGRQHSRKASDKNVSRKPSKSVGTESLSEDSDGWPRPSKKASNTWSESEDSSTTIKAPSSSNRTHTARTRREARSQRTKPASIHHEKKSSRPTSTPPTVTNGQPATVVIVPVPVSPYQGSSRKSSQHTETVAPAIPAPTWGCAVAAKESRKPSHATTHVSSAPRTTAHTKSAGIRRDSSHENDESDSFTTWGSVKTNREVSDPWKTSTAVHRSKSVHKNNGWDTAAEQKRDGGDWELVERVSKNARKDRKESKDKASKREPSENGWETGDPWKEDGPQGFTRIPPKEYVPIRHSKTRHTRRKETAGPVPNSHWQFPPPPSNENTLGRGTYAQKALMLPAEPLHEISKQTASEKGIQHQIKIGEGTKYGHAVSRPEYLDALDKPYAVFRFKYRSRAHLKTLFGDIIPDHGALALPAPGSVKLKAKEQLKGLSQNELIDKMVKLQSKLGKKKGKGVREEEGGWMARRLSDGQQTQQVAWDKTEDWVKQHARR
ncbi:hypothetical protein IQ07DRAFT_182271 [Pyrenochaeta sp. DS3sAY3a]|nr:hypothetical protein IQ07DRAFT_182271 [Pyrenochaeta sp. DS3sAY3a]